MNDLKQVTNSRLSKAANESGTKTFIVLFIASIGIDYSTGYFAGVPLYSLILLGLLTIILSVAQFKHILDLESHPIVLLSFMHIIYATAIIFVFPIGTVYAFLGLQIVFLSSYAFGKRGAFTSALLLFAAIELSYLFYSQNIDRQVFAELTRTLVVFAALSMTLYQVLHVTRKEIAALKKTSLKLRSEHQRMLSLINSMGDAVVSTDTLGRVTSYNGAALDILDTNETIINRKFNDFVSLLDGDGKPADIIAQAHAESRNIRRSDLVHTYSDGEKINLYINISPVKIGYGEKSESGFTIIMRDISKEKSLEEERDEFISVVSHELRTPITVTEGKVSNAILHNKNSNNDPKIAKSLDEAHKQILFLADMINDLATLARAERGDLDFNLEPVNPKEVMANLLANFEIEASQLGLSIKVQQDDYLPTINSSKLYIGEILQNFITNSLKYSKKGFITLEAHKVGEGVRFSVTDTGIGISKSDQAHLFDKFFRSEDYRTRESSGTGLGLYVTAKLARKIEGLIEVKSILNEGSTFSLTVKSLAEKKHRRHRSNLV